MGIGSIMSAEKILLIVSGKGKANTKVIEALFFHLPASILQLHKNVTIIADQEASSLLDQNY